MILDTIPYSTGKNLGQAYNQTMSLIGDNDHACLRDGDTCWLTPDYGVHLSEYVRLYPNAVLTCWTNRINERSEQQYRTLSTNDLMGREITDMVFHLALAKQVQRDGLYQVTPLHGFVSGFCMVVPKAVWQQTPFPETQQFEDRGPHNLLGVDNAWTNAVRAKGVPVLRMDGLYIFHVYRMLKGDADKSHLM